MDHPVCHATFVACTKTILYQYYADLIAFTELNTTFINYDNTAVEKLLETIGLL